MQSRMRTRSHEKISEITLRLDHVGVSVDRHDFRMSIDHFHASHLALVLAMLLASACSTQTVTQKRVLQPGEEGASGVVVGRIAACEKGQVAEADGKCRDVVVAAADGTQESLRGRAARAECIRIEETVRIAVKRRHELMARQGHDVHVALNGINNECRVREEQLDACERAARADAEVLNPSELVRKRDALDACRRLAGIYREMLASGMRKSP
jgi:hypothetical protein